MQRLDPIFAALAPGVERRPRTPGRETAGGTAEQGYLHCGPSGAGHFVKMVHNGIEYGLMAAYAEGLNILQHANVGKARAGRSTPRRRRCAIPSTTSTTSNLADIAEVWRRGSVDRLVAPRPDGGGAARAIRTWTDFAGRVSDSGEGRWTVMAAIDEGVPGRRSSPPRSTSGSRSRGEADFADKLLSAMRFQFGGITRSRAE